MIKRTIKKNLLVFVVVIISMSLSNIGVYAAVNVISKVSTEKIADLPVSTADGSKVTYTSVGGIATGKAKHSMFILKGNSADQQNTLFYYFPDMDNSSKYGVYRLPYAGHGNAMTVDVNNILVAGWVSDKNKLKDSGDLGNQENNTYNNWIIMIPRKTIASMGMTKIGKKIPKDDKSTEDVEGYTILYPKVKKTKSNGTVTYSDYKKHIASITKFNQDGVFLIGVSSPIDGDYLAYRKAYLETKNGQKMFVVSESPEDIYIIKNTVNNKEAIGQDICYSPNSGLFIPRWYGGGGTDNEDYNVLKNVILWVNIEGKYSTIKKDGVSYKVYTPKKINVNKSKEKDKYSLFEIESIAFQKDDTMIFSCNVKNASKKQADAVFKLHCNESLVKDKKFTIANFKILSE